jgi:transposase
VSRPTVLAWRAAFVAGGLTRFEQVASGRGRKPSIVQDTIDRIVELTLHHKPAGAAHWIDISVPRKLQIHLIVDNYGIHTHPHVQAWLAKHPRFHLHFTPTSSSSLNLVERWFAALTDKMIHRGVFHSVDDLIAAIIEFLRVHNDDPKPFVWTATADSILEKVRRGRVSSPKCKIKTETEHQELAGWIRADDRLEIVAAPFLCWAATDSGRGRPRRYLPLVTYQSGQKLPAADSDQGRRPPRSTCRGHRQLSSAQREILRNRV